MVAGTWLEGIQMPSESIPPDLCTAHCLTGNVGSAGCRCVANAALCNSDSVDFNPHPNWAAGLQSSLLFANALYQSIEAKNLAGTRAKLTTAGSLVEKERSTSLPRSCCVLLSLCFLVCQKKCFAVYKCLY